MAWTPNLIIPGVAKCGTTTIYDILVAHPRVTGGLEKEVRFLVDADEELATANNIRDQGLAGWSEQYADKGRGDFDIWLDASPQYQYQAIARETVARLEHTPKVLFIVRQPSARLFSLYQYARYHQRALPHVTSFAQFIDEIRPPVASALLNQKMMVTAWEDTHYDRMLDSWLKVVPADKLFALTLEELNRDRITVLGTVADWLGIDPAPLDSARTELSNPTVITRNKFIFKAGGKMARRLPENRVTRMIKSFAKNLNSKPIDKNERVAAQGLMNELDHEFAPAVARFEELRRTLGPAAAGS